MGSSVAVEVDVPAPIEHVWEALADLPSHVEWMADARRLEFLGSRRAGIGTRIEVETRLGPLRTSDVMQFTAWDPPHRMAVRHEGLFTGFGEFRLTEIAGGTRVSWREQLTFPWYAGSRLGAWTARPLLAWVWRRNLRRFRRRLIFP